MGQLRQLLAAMSGAMRAGEHALLPAVGADDEAFEDVRLALSLRRPSFGAAAMPGCAVA